MSRARTPLLAARLLQQCSGSACRAALDSAWSAALLNDVLAQSALLCCGAAARPATVDPVLPLRGQLQQVKHIGGCTPEREARTARLQHLCNLVLLTQAHKLTSNLMLAVWLQSSCDGELATGTCRWKRKYFFKYSASL